MSLMLKLLLSTILLSSFVNANESADEVEDFLQERFSENPNLDNLNISVVDTLKVEQLKGWDAHIVNIDATVKKDKRKISQKMIWFSDGNVITKELTLLSSGESLTDLVKPSFKESDYNKNNLIYGDVDAKHKVVIFSDPLCPFCRSFVPKAIKYMKKYPKKFAIYYYHFPLPAIHPASVDLVKAATVAELQGEKDVILNLYKVKVNARERDTKKILKAFNKTMKTDIKVSDIKSKEIIKHFNNDLKTASDFFVGGTPTIFFDGKIDKTKKLYEKAN